MEGNGKASWISSAFVYISVEHSVRPIHVDHLAIDDVQVILSKQF
jgi:hypothetical protein